MNIIKKISVATVHGALDKKALFALPEGQSMRVMRVFGVATGVETGTSSMGDWECLTGEFKAINTDDEEFYSGKAFLPGAGHSVVAGRLLGAGTEGVEFVFDFAAVADKPGAKPSATGYTYQVKPVIEQPAESRIRRLEGQITALMEKAGTDAVKENAATGKEKGKK